MWICRQCCLYILNCYSKRIKEGLLQYKYSTESWLTKKFQLVWRKRSNVSVAGGSAPEAEILKWLNWSVLGISSVFGRSVWPKWKLLTRSDVFKCLHKSLQLTIVNYVHFVRSLTPVMLPALLTCDCWSRMWSSLRVSWRNMLYASVL